MAKAVTRAKAKKKKWYPLIAPKLFNENQIGEAYVAEPNDLIGKTVSINIREIASGRNNPNMNVEFEVKDMQDGKGRTFCRGFKMAPGAVNRYVRKGRERVDDSFVLKTKDDFKVRVKPMMVTTNNTANSVLTKMRKKTKQKLSKEFSQKNFNEILNSVFNTQLQKRMRDELSTVYPIRNFEIRVMKLADKSKAPEEEEDEASEETEEFEEQESEESEDSEEKDSE